MGVCLSSEESKKLPSLVSQLIYSILSLGNAFLAKSTSQILAVAHRHCLACLVSSNWREDCEMFASQGSAGEQIGFHHNDSGSMWQFPSLPSIPYCAFTASSLNRMNGMNESEWHECNEWMNEEYLRNPRQFLVAYSCMPTDKWLVLGQSTMSVSNFRHSPGWPSRRTRNIFAEQEVNKGV